MFTNHIDLGQILISVLIGIVGWFVKKTIDKFEKRIDAHDVLIFEISGHIQNVMGMLGSRYTDRSLK